MSEDAEYAERARIHNNDAIRMFAKASITAALTINSGALVATLSQLDQLKDLPAGNVGGAFKWWALGVAAAALAWVVVTLTSSFHANGSRQREMVAGWLGYACVIGSIACFVLGALEVAAGL